MSNSHEDIVNLECVLIRLGSADTDDQLQVIVYKYLPLLLSKISSPESNVRSRVMEVLTHINKRIRSRPLIQVPIEPLLELYKDPQANSFLINFAIIYIKIGYPRMQVSKQVELAPILLSCLEGKPEMHYDKIFPLVLPVLSEIGQDKSITNRENVLGLDGHPQLKTSFLNYICDVLLLPYGYNQDVASTGFTPPPAMSMYSFKRVTQETLKPEDLQKLKEYIMTFLSSGALSPEDSLLPLVIASADTRFSVVNPATSELARISSGLDWSNANLMKPLYLLFSGSVHKLAERKTSPADPRVKLKVLQYLYKAKGAAMNVTLALKVIFEGLFGNTNDKCRKMTLSFATLMITECTKEELQPVITILFNGLLKMTSEEYPVEIRNAAYLTLTNIPKKCPDVFLQRRDLVVMLFDKITQETESVQSSIRDLLVAITPLFHYDTIHSGGLGNATDSEASLILALLARHIEGNSFNAAFVATVYLMTCFPAQNVAAKYLMLMGLHNDLLKEKIFTDLYGTYKLDSIKYSQLKSFDFVDCEMEIDSKEPVDPESEKTIILPSFKSFIDYVYEQALKRKGNPSLSVSYKNESLPYNTKVYTEVIKYCRLCLFMSAGLTGPSPLENVPLLAKYLSQEDKQSSVRNYITLLKQLLLVSKGETELSSMIDILACVPRIANEQMDLLPVSKALLQDVSREKRDSAATLYGMLSIAQASSEFDKDLQTLIAQSKSTSIPDEHKHGLILAFSNACERRIKYSKRNSDANISNETFAQTVNALLYHVLSAKPVIIEAACIGISLIGKSTVLPLPVGNDPAQYSNSDLDDINNKAKLVKKLFALMNDSSAKSQVREKAVLCLGHICVGEHFPWTKYILEGFMNYIKETRDVDMHLTISKSLVCCILGRKSPESKDIWSTSDIDNDEEDSQMNIDSTNEFSKYVLEYLLAHVKSPHPNSRQACSIWLLAIVKSCSGNTVVKERLPSIQSAFIDLLSEENDIVQDSASSGLGMVYQNSDKDSQKELAVTLLEQLSGGSRTVKQVTSDTPVYQEGTLGKAPTGGNLSTYKELCSLASDLNQPDLIYKFMQLANHNANWNSKLGAAFGIKTIATLAQQEIQVFLPKIISRLYRYKYDPIPKIQNSMCAIWNAVVQDNKSTITKYHHEIVSDILSNITHHQWRVRMSCCLALSDLLRSHPLPCNEHVEQMWLQLFRVMDDVHEATRRAAENTTVTLSKVCVLVCKSESGFKAGHALASTFLPVLLDNGITNTVKEIRNISLHTISELVQYSGPILQPHMPRLIPALLSATGELESAYLNQLSAMWGARQEAQEALDCARADAAKGHAATKTMSKCIEFMDLETLALTTPCVVELMRNSMVLGTRVACAHYLNIIVSIKRAEAKNLDKSLIDRIFSTLHTGLGDRNAAVKRSHAEAIGHMVGVAQESSLQKLFDKLWKAYFSHKTNRRAAIARTILCINNSEPDVLRTYSNKVIPLVFFAMHEDKNEENMKTIELWDNIWQDITSGDSDIRNHIMQIMQILKTELESPHWTMKAQAANAVSTVAKKVGSSLSEDDRKSLMEILLNGLSGRTWSGKQHLLVAVVDLCVSAAKNVTVNQSLVLDAVFRESRKKEPVYRKFALSALGDLLDVFDEDRFEEFYTSFEDLLNMDIASMEMDSDDISEKTENRKNYLALKEVIWESLGKAWSNNFDIQEKYRYQFLEHCSESLKTNTRNVQLKIMITLNQYMNKLIIVESESRRISVENFQKVIEKLISIVNSALDTSFTSIKKEALGAIQTLLLKLKGNSGFEDLYRRLVDVIVNDISPKALKDKAPEIQSRVKDILDNTKS